MTGSAYIVGGAMIPFGKHRAASYVGLAMPPLVRLLKDTGIAKDRIGAAFVGHAYGGMMTGQRILKEVGLGGLPVYNVDNACSGGASALRLACEAVQDGKVDIALVIGVEKLTQFGGGTLPLSPEDREVRQGVSMPAIYAMRAQRYLHETDADVRDFAAVSVKSRRHAAENPFAQMRTPTTIDEVLATRPIATPFTLAMCCPTGDGAAAVIVASDKVRRELARPSMRVAASAFHTGVVAEGFRNMIRPEITEHCASEAYETAGIGPEDLDIIELHDAFASAEIIYYESFGLAPRGEGFKLIRENRTTHGGDVVVNPSGGLLSRGHPVGASGVAQIVEIFWHLTDQASSRQVLDARWALAHVTGGGTAGLDHGACCVHIFEREAA